MKAWPTGWRIHSRSHPQLAPLFELVDGATDFDAQWPVRLRACLEELLADLGRHYEAEEEGELYSSIPRAHPQFRQPLLDLVSEHDEIRATLDSILGSCEEAVGDPARCEALALRASLLAARVRRHEASEDVILLSAALLEVAP